ncbi:uncharacterized protein B0I36DRAFT_326369 [Microdochium trichocladiopsis]|uniref:Uncharacterized protein n=1 Tax=Microdochium trichocladiopsis TaxID=1682393 RepID=A0A9P8Y7W5_9PEZI|nr:uncharacterized protein B0I36DRAFT_326369 [Microdochium trichocladiopsis]KAH7029796.1 hypothetical protein B0I36DRAFT_326369 [Microdochium trichocladiopsis]
MHFTSNLFTTALFAGAALAAPAPSYHHVDAQTGITVELTNTAGHVTTLAGFSATGAVTRQAEAHAGEIAKIRVVFSDAAKKSYPFLEPSFRCAARRAPNNQRIIVTRGSSIDFNFGDGGNPNVWSFKNNEAIHASDLSITCDPTFSKIDPARVNDIRVQLSDDARELAVQLDFSASKGAWDLTIPTGGNFVQAELFVGPGIDNQALRCQAVGHGQVVKFNRGANLNKETIGDGGNGEWTVSSGVATAIDKVTCSPRFV